MKNPRVTKKERGLIKGSLRRVFSRSELRKAILDASVEMYSDPTRARVKRWSRCAICKKLHPSYAMEVDHKSPIVRFDEVGTDLDANTLIDRLWCEENNLQICCSPCHDQKSALEAKERKAVRDSKKPPKVKNLKGKKSLKQNSKGAKKSE